MRLRLIPADKENEAARGVEREIYSAFHYVYPRPCAVSLCVSAREAKLALIEIANLGTRY